MKYKVGDKVRVRKDLIQGNKYGNVIYVSSMDKFKDRECIITYVDDTSYNINDSKYWFSQEMLQPVDNTEALLEYALEKLGITEEELESEMNSYEEHIEKVKEIAELTKQAESYCRSFNGKCEKCEIKEFKDKYHKFGKMKCIAVFEYLREKGEI